MCIRDRQYVNKGLIVARGVLASFTRCGLVYSIIFLLFRIAVSSTPLLDFSDVLDSHLYIVEWSASTTIKGGLMLWCVFCMIAVFSVWVSHLPACATDSRVFFWGGGSIAADCPLRFSRLIGSNDMRFLPSSFDFEFCFPFCFSTSPAILPLTVY